MGVFPLGFYFICFCLLTYPLILRFSTHFFADKGDGLINVWNLWWVNKSITQLSQSPWFTNYIHYPHGTSLLGHTLNPFNGFLTIVLLKFMTLLQANNFIIIFSFIVGGFTTFLLSYYITKSYWGSIIAGFIFTFSNYHFAHAQGHLNLVSLEWIPLFVLFWYKFIIKPRIVTAILSSVVLFAIVLCDYYYFFYSLLIAFIILVWHALKIKDLFFIIKQKYLYPFITFFVTSFFTTGSLIISLINLNLKDPLFRGHNPNIYSLDLLAPIIPGGAWRFAELTKFYWNYLPGNIYESSVHMGISVISIIIAVWIYRRYSSIQSLKLWYFILIFFFIMSLGPVLHISGKEISFIKLPYAMLEKIFPLIKLSGVPVRMMLITMLAASVISAIGFNILLQGSAVSRWFALLLIVSLCFEYIPKPLPSNKIAIPEYTYILKKLPDNKGLIDAINEPAYALLYQTIHEKPMTFSKRRGYIARTPGSVYIKDKVLKLLIKYKQFRRLLHGYNIRYILVGSKVKIVSNHQEIKILYNDGKVKLYDLGSDY